MLYFYNLKCTKLPFIPRYNLAVPLHPNFSHALTVTWKYEARLFPLPHCQFRPIRLRLQLLLLFVEPILYISRREKSTE